MLCSPEDACWFHRASSFRAEDTLHHHSPLHLKKLAVIANPTFVWKLIDAVALLVNRDIAHVAEDNQVLIFIVAIVADGALGVLLHYQTPLGSGE